ncbi:EF-hand domain-containing protein [Sulfitobacter sp. 1A13353]|uniref:EF-hand domain-containing protein n=1 Tax=Sulfitobacter sp. 1A13353 TaxID=3368568 RepID=UPI003746AFD2
MRPNKTAVSTISIMAIAVALMGAPAFAWQDKGIMTRADALQMAGERFDKVDADGDGVVTAEERKGARMHAKGKMDKAKRPHLDRGEFFSKIDADGSGDLSLEEFSSAAKRMEKHREAKRDLKHEGKHDRKARQTPAERFAELDANQDGVLSKDEFGPVKKHRKKHGAKKHKDK